jgi:aminopeptidase N
MEATFGRDRLVDGMKTARDNVLAFYERRPNAPIVNPSITDPNQHLNANSYQKGAWVLHMLRHAVGDENFWAGIRAYYEAFRDANATSEDLQKKLEEVSGQDLSAFFNQWLYQSGQPTIEGSWSYDAGRKALDITLRQTQDTEFVFPLEIGIDTGGASRVENVLVDSKEASFTITVDAQPTGVVLDPNTWLLASMELAPR